MADATRCFCPMTPTVPRDNFIAQSRSALGSPSRFSITDSFGRPWREGLIDFCIGMAGMKPLRDDRGRRDPHGYTLQASIEAVADELACAAGLVCGKLNRTPACIIRGFRYEPAGTRSRSASPCSHRSVPLDLAKRQPLGVIWNT